MIKRISVIPTAAWERRENLRKKILSVRHSNADEHRSKSKWIEEQREIAKHHMFDEATHVVTLNNENGDKVSHVIYAPPVLCGDRAYTLLYVEVKDMFNGSAQGTLHNIQEIK